MDPTTRRTKRPPSATVGWATIVLASAAGAVDAVGYVALFRLFTAHMSGNSVAFGLALGQGSLGEIVRHGVPIPLFLVGVAAGALLVESLKRRGRRRVLSVALGVEFGMLVALIVVGGACVAGAATTPALLHVPVLRDRSKPLQCRKPSPARPLARCSH